MTQDSLDNLPISWNEIKTRTLEFQKSWIGEKRERAEKDTFWNEFFGIFGVNRRRVASFETAVRKLGNKQGFIDCFWEGVILIEHKSKGKDLTKAYEQATDYFSGLTDEQLPQYVLVSDFDKFHLYNLEDKTDYAFSLDQLLENIELFGFIAGYNQIKFVAEDPVNIKASELMGELHDAIQSSGFGEINDGHDLEIFLTRILFLLFAEDTQIFETRQFHNYILTKTRPDGFDTGSAIGYLFQILNTNPNLRLKNLDQDLAKFAYINGQLFDQTISIPQFDSKTRASLIKCCEFDWSKISPAVFGSLFQSVMNPTQRRSFGAHYTEEKNILKTIEPLFLDELWSEFDSLKTNRKKLIEFHLKLKQLTFFDPACGCGNFLIVTYRELRKLELAVLLRLHVSSTEVLDVSTLSIVDVDQFYGIEIEEFPAQIAKTAMWLIDHIANLELSKAFGAYFARIPLKSSATIIHGNSLTINWLDIFSPKYPSYIIGNPPFVGSKMLSSAQRQEIIPIIGNIQNYGILDYVCNWYVKAGQIIKANPKTQGAFVSTNSICQGEQVGVLWRYMLEQCGIQIKFAHQTFAWSSEARGKANVFCVIVGFGQGEFKTKKLFSYETPRSDPEMHLVCNINPYLVEGENVIITSRSKPISDVPEMFQGNNYAKSEGLIVEAEDVEDLIAKEPNAQKYIKKLIGAREFLNNTPRYCLWLVDCSPNELRSMPLVLERIARVKKDRLISKDAGMHKLALTPTLFRETRNPEKCLIIPVVSSESREYIPMAFIDQNTITVNANLLIENATLFHFAILTSKMHMAWVKMVCGRLESRFRYSKDIVYNNFPFPAIDSDTRIEQLAQNILDIRLAYTDSSLADLYNPLTMPPDLAKAHNELDKAVDKLYLQNSPLEMTGTAGLDPATNCPKGWTHSGRGVFQNDSQRVSFLFGLYKELSVIKK